MKNSFFHSKQESIESISTYLRRGLCNTNIYTNFDKIVDSVFVCGVQFGEYFFRSEKLEAAGDLTKLVGKNQQHVAKELGQKFN